MNSSSGSRLVRSEAARAAALLLTRRTARASLIEFTRCTWPGYRAAEFHRHIAGELEAVANGHTDRLMLMIPPRHGKSELASRRFVAWYLGRFPDRQIISTSATMELATDFGRDVRNIIASPEYRALFPAAELAGDSQAKGKWHTSQGGVYYAVGVGGAILGRGAHVLMIDDPFASMADAQSETQRKAVWDWYTGTLYNRLMPGGAIVIIGHRMHEDDLQGRLLEKAKHGGDKWRVVKMPIDDDCTALWPEDYPQEALQRIRANTLPAYWSAMYQQNPTPDDGTFFLSHWFIEGGRPPDNLRTYGASDYAVTQDGGDWTVHVVVGIDENDFPYLLDVWRGQETPNVWVDAFCSLVNKWRPLGWAEESGQILSAIGPFLQKRIAERAAWVRRQRFASKAHKEIRAQSIQGLIASKGLRVCATEPWWPSLRAELLSFPAGKHDDQVDALGLVGQLLDVMVAPRKPQPLDSGPKFLYSDIGQPVPVGSATFNDLVNVNKRARERRFLGD